MGNRISRRRKDKIAKSVKSSEVDTAVTSFQDGSMSMYSQPKFQTFEPFYPRSDAETARLQSGHYILKHLFQQSYRAPIEDILSKPGTLALDVGAGPMAPWVIEMASDFPNAIIYGLDLYEPFADTPAHAPIPENCRFLQRNILEGVDVPDNHFDYVHQRMMYSVYHGDDVIWVMKELFRITKPNGFLEMLEHDMAPKKAGPLFGKVMGAAVEFMKNRRANHFCGPRLRRFLVEAGFINIKTDYVSVPICWGGHVGKLIYENVLAALRHLGPHIYHDIGLAGAYDSDDFEAFLDKAFNECSEHQTFLNIHWAYGQKPSQT